MFLIAHLDRVHHRPLSLSFERSRPAVPEHGLAVSGVDDRRSAAVSGLTLDSGGNRTAVGPALGRIVASGATDRVVSRDSRIEIKLTPQFILPAGERIGGRNHDLGRERLQPGRNLHLKRFVRDQFGLGSLPEIIGRTCGVLLGWLVWLFLSQRHRVDKPAGPAAHASDQEHGGNEIGE